MDIEEKRYRALMDDSAKENWHPFWVKLEGEWVIVPGDQLTPSPIEDVLQVIGVGSGALDAWRRAVGVEDRKAGWAL